MRPKKTSTHLILLLLALLGLGLLMALFIHRTVSNLKGDADIINQVGIIRGSMQRVVKLELVEPGSTDRLIESVNERLQHIIAGLSKKPERAVERKAAEQIRKTAESWRELQAALLEYRAAPTPEGRRKLLALSEESWRAAEAAVLAAQQFTEYKVAEIRFFYVVLALNAATALFVLWVVYAYVRKKIEYQATHDRLTGLLNRHSFEQEAQNEIFRSKRYRHPFSLIIFDIDHFKQINDRHGHKAGDHVLSAMGTLVKGLMRKSDQVFRIGGEEFAIVASETPGASGARLAEKVRQEVEGHEFGLDKAVTISLGVAEWQSEDDVAGVLRNADEALYRAKREGRNRSCLYTSGAAPNTT